MAKGIMYVDGQRVPFDGEPNVLSVIRKAGIEMPTFCYYSDLSVYGACRMCVIEDERGKIEASCSMQPKDGLRIRTHTAKLLKHRRMILELMLASHNCDCTTCEKSGACHLQDLANQFGVNKVRFADSREEKDIDNSTTARFSSLLCLCASFSRISPERSTICSGIPISSNAARMLSTSPLRIRPVSTKMAVIFSPKASQAK